MTKDFEKAKRRYNKMMNSLGLEHLTIGEELSEETENWNIRDMVSEAQYQLDLYYDPETASGMMLYEDEECKKGWRSETGQLSRYINAWEEVAMTMECETEHCSKYD